MTDKPKLPWEKINCHRCFDDKNGYWDMALKPTSQCSYCNQTGHLGYALSEDEATALLTELEQLRNQGYNAKRALIEDNRRLTERVKMAEEAAKWIIETKDDAGFCGADLGHLEKCEFDSMVDLLRKFMEAK